MPLVTQMKMTKLVYSLHGKDKDKDIKTRAKVGHVMTLAQQAETRDECKRCHLFCSLQSGISIVATTWVWSPLHHLCKSSGGDCKNVCFPS